MKITKKKQLKQNCWGNLLATQAHQKTNKQKQMFKQVEAVCVAFPSDAHID